MKPALVEVSVGWVNPMDDDILEWTRPVPMTREHAAFALWIARRQRLRIEREQSGGYAISGALNPAWNYARS